jgi:hypothetical protein
MNFDDAMRELEGMPGKIDRVLTDTMRRASKQIAAESRLNAPKSPTQAELDADRTAKYGKKHTAKVKKRRGKVRKANASSRPAPGGLMQSIASEVIKAGQNVDGSIFVASNSAAVKYARRIHDDKGKTWNERGIGTEKKGPRADEKFIERAVNASDASITRILEAEINRALESIP